MMRYIGLKKRAISARISFWDFFVNIEFCNKCLFVDNANVNKVDYRSSKCNQSLIVQAEIKNVKQKANC